MPRAVNPISLEFVGSNPTAEANIATRAGIIKGFYIMVDIVERLRILSEFRTVAPATTLEAADEIERLRSRVEQLRSLIVEWVDANDEYAADTTPTLGRIESAEHQLRKAVGR
jgi:hypothetical protein